MEFNIEEAFFVCGSGNRYQRIVLGTSILTWLSMNYISIVYPLMSLEPDYYCKIENEFNLCNRQVFCNLSADKVKRIIEYKNILTEFEIDCNTFEIILLGLIYAFGNIIGSLATSFLSDLIGRKPVLVYSSSLYILSCIVFLISPNYVIFLIGLFICGIANAGGCLITFMYLNELISPEKRSLYSISLNVIYATIGISYLVLFQYLKNWDYLSCYTIGLSLATLPIFVFYFVESPRFYYSNKEYTLSLKQFYSIAKKNNRQEEFRKFLKRNYQIFLKKNSFDFFNKLNTSFQSSLNTIKIIPFHDYNNRNIDAPSGLEQKFINNLYKDYSNKMSCYKDFNQNIVNNFLNEDDKNLINQANEIDDILNYLEHYECEKCLEHPKINHEKANGEENPNDHFNDNKDSKDNIKFHKPNQESDFNVGIETTNNNKTEKDENSNSDKNTPLLTEKINYKMNETDHDNKKKIGNRSPFNICDVAEDDWSENSSIGSSPNRSIEDNDDADKNHISEEKNLNDSTSNKLQISNEIKQEESFKYLKSETCLKLNHILKKDFTNKLSLSPRRRKFQTSINYLPLIKNKSIKKEFFICNLIWITYGLTYYSISLILKKGKKDVFFDLYIIAMAEIISYFITFFIMRSQTFGRVRALNVMLFLAGISSLIYYFMNLYGYGVLKVIALFAARFGISSIRSLIYTYSTEFYPTVIRAKGLGINLLCSRIAVCLVPVLIELTQYTFIYLSAICLFSCFFSIFLPETNNKKLKDDLTD